MSWTYGIQVLLDYLYTQKYPSWYPSLVQICGYAPYLQGPSSLLHALSLYISWFYGTKG